MSAHLHIRILFIALCLLLNVTGCAPFLVALPPPASLPTDARQTPGGGIEVAGGVSAILPGAPNLLGGAGGARLAYGLTDKVDIALQAGGLGVGNGGALQVGYRLVQRPRFQLGAIGSLAGIHTRFTESTGCDVNGENCTLSTTYRYLSVAPGLGLRTSIKLHPRLDLIGILRGSYSLTVTLAGYQPGQEDQAFWLEPEVGLVFAATQKLRLGLGIGVSMMDFQTPTPTAAASISYTFPTGRAGKMPVP